MKYVIKIQGDESTVRITQNCDGKFTKLDLVKVINSLMDAHGISGKDEVVEFCVALATVSEFYETSKQQTIMIDLEGAKKQMQNEGSSDD